jgi:hypothetical protein
MKGVVEDVCAREDGMVGEGCLGDGTARLLLSWIEWVEVEAWGWPDLMERIERLRGTVTEAIAGVILAPPETYTTGGGLSKSSKEAVPAWTIR